MLNIDIWSDFACPFCYLGETRLYNAINDLGVADKVTINFKAFQLNPAAPAEGVQTLPERMAEKHRLTPLEVQHRLTRIYELGRDMGLDLDLKNTKTTNTFDAHRLMKLAEDKYDQNTVEKLNSLLFKAMFSEGQMLGTKTVLLQVAKDAGITVDDALGVLQGDAYAEAVKADEREAENLRVAGVPYFLVDKKTAVPGMISTEDFKQLISELLDARKRPHPLHDYHPETC